MSIADVKALTFDVFGTVVDWFGTIVRQGASLGAAHGLQIDWSSVARRWAEKYVAGRKPPWRPLDEILRQAGHELIFEFHIDGLTEAEHERWINLWSQLEPWPDSVPGLNSLAAGYRLAALSNANVALCQALAAHAGLPWNLVIGPDAVQVYKPDPRVYCHALRQLGLEGPEVMMVAAHLFDLEGAKKMGLQTAFIRRPGEETEDPELAPYVDIIADNLQDLATKLMS